MSDHLNPAAVDALIALEAGVKMNTMHTVARELIAAGMAIDGWGTLEITEMGRRVARTFRSFVADGVSNMGDLNELKWTTPAVSHDVEPLKIRDAEHYKSLKEMPVGPTPVSTGLPVTGENEPVEKSLTSLTWSRARARAAAGVANGCIGEWVDEHWIAAFLEAYEQIA